jgi:hypothetical protein
MQILWSYPTGTKETIMSWPVLLALATGVCLAAPGAIRE